MSVKRVSYLGLFLAISLVISYIEAILPPLSGIPGVKPGLSNIVTDEEILATCLRCSDLEECCRDLLSQAYVRGAGDNVTIALVVKS